LRGAYTGTPARPRKTSRATPPPRISPSLFDKPFQNNSRGLLGDLADVLVRHVIKYLAAMDLRLPWMRSGSAYSEENMPSGQKKSGERERKKKEKQT
jgi:hypothetical protein